MEPLLERISAIIPDEKIDHELSFPQPKRGPRHQLRPSHGLHGNQAQKTAA